MTHWHKISPDRMFPTKCNMEKHIVVVIKILSGSRPFIAFQLFQGYFLSRKFLTATLSFVKIWNFSRKTFLTILRRFIIYFVFLKFQCLIKDMPFEHDIETQIDNVITTLAYLDISSAWCWNTLLDFILYNSTLDQSPIWSLLTAD